MNKVRIGCTLSIITVSGAISSHSAPAPSRFTETFAPAKSTFASVGSNPFFVLQPGLVQTYDGVEDGERVHLTIAVTSQTKKVAGVETRVVVERETHDGELVEISSNYFAICQQNNSVFYFGEQVDNYENGKIANHGGSWLAGIKGAKAGLVMPALPLLGARYAQELAPGAAMDRAEIISVSETLNTPAGNFKACLKTEETSALEPGKEYKWYAPGVGLIADGSLKLSKIAYPQCDDSREIVKRWFWPRI